MQVIYYFKIEFSVDKPRKKIKNNSKVFLKSVDIVYIVGKLDIR